MTLQAEIQPPQLHCLHGDCLPADHPHCQRRNAEGCADCRFSMTILPGRSGLAQYQDHQASHPPEESGSDSSTTH